eukprot:2179039-Pleurochrysis_carterae.AAC.2
MQPTDPSATIVLPAITSLSFQQLSVVFRRGAREEGAALLRMLRAMPAPSSGSARKLWRRRGGRLRAQVRAQVHI